MASAYNQLWKVKASDCTVNRMLHGVEPGRLTIDVLTEVVCALADDKARLQEQLLQQQSLLPKRRRLADGRVVLYRVPADMIPIESEQT